MKPDEVEAGLEFCDQNMDVARFKRIIVFSRVFWYNKVNPFFQKNYWIVNWCLLLLICVLLLNLLHYLCLRHFVHILNFWSDCNPGSVAIAPSGLIILSNLKDVAPIFSDWSKSLKDYLVETRVGMYEDVFIGIDLAYGDDGSEGMISDFLDEMESTYGISTLLTVDGLQITSPKRPYKKFDLVNDFGGTYDGILQDFCDGCPEERKDSKAKRFISSIHRASRVTHRMYKYVGFRNQVLFNGLGFLKSRRASGSAIGYRGIF
eukprot:GDKJ01017913.1.p1 GENE.GDKJ01017913.1~~GDKJ01017913.1.p1  ORF type:complete len:283 (-),score=24.61 GDKJ01017913.1:442-1227(-)